MNGWRALDIEEELLMRRIIALCIAAVLVFCVAACGSQGAENEITQSSGTKTSAAESQGLSTENSAVNFEDYRSRQKTGVVPDGLDTGNAPKECDYFAGDMN